MKLINLSKKCQEASNLLEDIGLVKLRREKNREVTSLAYTIDQISKIGGRD